MHFNKDSLSLSQFLFFYLKQTRERQMKETHKILLTIVYQQYNPICTIPHKTIFKKLQFRIAAGLFRRDNKREKKLRGFIMVAHERIHNLQKPKCICIVWFCLLVSLSHHGRASSSSSSSSSSIFNLSLPHQHPFPEHVVLNLQRYSFSSILFASGFYSFPCFILWVFLILK